ncbi:insulinase family protein [Lysinibacillus capsici]|uniref:M16 family metallopeptidase n=1 Tax=Lysinibacillus capsici TaxID=2115968 RepID=UPI0029DE8630|nr:insulinase family protein [Lysinibacillus capsici]WPK05543.1 insulinase family protein [Lysinibacillus capsici]
MDSFYELYKRFLSEEEMLKSYYYEHGLSIDQFLSLTNMVMELLPLELNEPCEKIWAKYLSHNRLINRERVKPNFEIDSFDEIFGEEYMMETLSEGGAFLTWHFGDYRHNTDQIIKALRFKLQDKNRKFFVVVDQESYESEGKLEAWEKVREEAGVRLLVAESKLIAIKLFYLLKENNSFLLFLDGQAGFNEDNADIRTKFLSSEIKVRSGIFRILEKAKKKICILITTMSEDGKKQIIFYKPFLVEPNKIDEAVNKAFSIFTAELIKKPELWRLWYRHDEQVLNWHSSVNIDNGRPIQIDWRTKDIHSNQMLGLDAKNARLFELETEELSLNMQQISGINYFIHQNDKYMNSTIRLSLLYPLKKVMASSISIFSELLIPHDIQAKLDHLYGATLKSNVSRKGDYQVLEFEMSIIQDKSLDSDILSNSLKLLSEIIYSSLENGFNSERVEKEFLNHYNRIQEINDYVEYTVQEKCLSIMTEGEPFSTSIFGDLNTLKDLNSKILFKHYQDFIASAKIYIHIIGPNIDEKRIQNNICDYFKREKESIVLSKENMISSINEEIKYIEHESTTKQGRLLIGFKTGINLSSQNYIHLLVFNAIFGNLPSSKLQTEIRHKRGLAYYLRSEIEDLKGILLIHVALQEENYEMVTKIVLDELNKIRDGGITEEEIQAGVNAVKHFVKSGLETPAILIDISLTGELLDYQDDENKFFSRLDNISKKNIVDVAKEITLDTVFKSVRKTVEI